MAKGQLGSGTAGDQNLVNMTTFLFQGLFHAAQSEKMVGFSQRFHINFSRWYFNVWIYIHLFPGFISSVHGVSELLAPLCGEPTGYQLKSLLIWLVIQSFGDFLVVSLDMVFNKQSNSRWNETPWHFCSNWPFPMRGIHRSRWIPHTKDNDAELWCFLWSASG